MTDHTYYALLAAIIWAPHIPRWHAMGATVALLAASVLARIIE